MTLNNNNDKGIRTPPLVSAADFAEANFLRGRFDDNLTWLAKDIGRCRAPNEESEWRHQIGAAGELVTGAALKTSIDKTITEPYVGDDGFDLKYDGYRVEVKTVTSDEDYQLKVPEHQVETADYFVLAKCSRPSGLVQLIGWTRQAELQEHGFQFRGDDLVHLGPDWLMPFEPVFLTPDRIRKAHQHQ